MYGAKYVWFLTHELKPEDVLSTECDNSELGKAAQGLIIQHVPIRQDDETTASGLTADEFLDEVEKRNNQSTPESSYAFDSIWAAALMLNETLSGPKEYHPENFVLGEEKFAQVYREMLLQTKFEGLSGPHAFHKRERMGTVHISHFQFKNGIVDEFQIGRHDAAKNKLTLDEEEFRKIWKDGIPTDDVPEKYEVMTYTLAQFLIINILAVLGLIYSLALLHFNISKRKCKVVRMSSPMINNVILLGCCLCYVYVLLLGIDFTIDNNHILGILCNIRLYVLAIAFSMAFGALFSKNWRVHKIFTAQHAIKTKKMRYFHLISFVLALVLIDVIFISFWMRYDPLKLQEDVFHDKIEYLSDQIVIPVLKVCECAHRTKFLGALYGYKGVLLLFGVFLAWETRNVTILALNDSKYIGMSIYNVVILSAIGATVSLVLKHTDHYDLIHAIVSVVVLVSTTVTLSMVFLPKVYQYYCTPTEPENRVRTFETSQTNDVTTAEDYQGHVKPAKGVKHKWTQTENIDEVVNDKSTVATSSEIGI